MATYKYTELASWLRKNIESNVYINGTQIPTEMELATMFSVSRDTVRQAISKLEDEGLLTRIKGSGTYVNAPQQTLPLVTPQKAKHMRIGVLMNDLDSYIFPAIIRGINKVLTEKGYSMDLRFTSNHVSPEHTFLQAMATDGVDGLIIEPPKSALPLLNRPLYEKISTTIPTVLFHARYDIPNLSCITTGNNRGCYELTNYLINKGHRNIAIICKFDEQTGTERYLGYARALQDSGIPMTDSNVCWFPSEETTTLFTNQNNTALFTAIKNATAIICQDDRVAVQLINYLKSINLRVPEDVSIVGFDNAEIAESFNLTTMEHPKESFGEFVAEQLFEKMEAPYRDVSYTFTPTLIERETVMTVTP